MDQLTLAAYERLEHRYEVELAQLRALGLDDQADQLDAELDSILRHAYSLA